MLVTEDSVVCRTSNQEGDRKFKVEIYSDKVALVIDTYDDPSDRYVKMQLEDIPYVAVLMMAEYFRAKRK